MDKLSEVIPPKTAKRVVIHFLILTACIGAALALIGNSELNMLLRNSSSIGFIGAAFVSGFFFTSAFTTPIAISALVALGQSHNPLIITPIASLGAVLGDVILLKIIKEDIIADVEVFTKPFTTPRLKHILHARALYFPLALLAAIILASPLPDEISIALFGIIKFKTHHFGLICFVFNFLGILLITSAGNFFT